MTVGAVYPGTFDPFTRGHEDLVRRAAVIFDKVVVAIATSPGKTPLFSLEERVGLATKVLQSVEGVIVTGYEGLTVDFARALEYHLGRTNDTGTDLATVAARDSNVHDRHDICIDYPEDVDGRRCTPITQIGNVKVRVLAHGDIVEIQVTPDHCFRRAALVFLQWERGSLGETTESHGLGNNALATHPGDLVLIVALVVGLAVSIFQAVTQVHEMTLTFVGATLVIVLPWMLQRMLDFTMKLLMSIPALVG